MAEALWFTDPTNDTAHPLRQLFRSKRSLTSKGFQEARWSQFPDIRSGILEIMLHTDPLITVRGSDFQYNWPGIEDAEDILHMLLEDLEDGDDPETVWNRHGEALASYDFENAFEFRCFLCFGEVVAPDGSLDANAVQALLEAMESETGFVDPTLSPITDYLISAEGYCSFEDIRKHCQIDDTEVESIRFMMDSSPLIIRIGDFYRIDTERNPESLISIKWPRESKLFLPDFYRDNETALRGLGYHSDFELIRDLERLFPDSMSSVSIFDTKGIVGARDSRLKEMFESRSERGIGNILAPGSDRLRPLVSEHMGSSFPLLDAQSVTGMSHQEVVNALYRFGNVYIDRDLVWVYDIDGRGLHGIVGGHADGERHGLTDILGDDRLTDLNIVSVDGLAALMTSHFPEAIDPVSLGIDTAPFGDSAPSEPRSEPAAPDRPADAAEMRIYRTVREMNQANRFKIRRALPDLSDEDFDDALNILVACNYVLRGPLGLECNPDRMPGGDPLLAGDRRGAGSKKKGSPTTYVHGTPESRLHSLESFEELMLDVVKDSVGYDPSSRIPGMIDGIKSRRVKEAVQKLLYEGRDAHTVLSKLKEAEADEVLELLAGVILDRDKELFTTYDIPSNMFMLLFNRSEEYYRALSIAFERGKDSPQNMIPKMIADGLEVRRSESSEGCMNARDRYLAMFDAFNSTDWLIEKSDDVDAIMFTLFMFNEYSLLRYELIELCRDLIGEDDGVDSVGDVGIWSALPDFVEVTVDSAEFRSFDTVMSVNELLVSSTSLYAHDLKKFQKQNRKELAGHDLYSLYPLPWFIKKLGLVRLEDGFILGRGDLRGSIARYADDNQLYDRTQILDKYIRKFGGRKDVLEPIVADVCEDRRELDELDEDVVHSLESEFEGYEWVTGVNARSLIEDKCGYKGAFSAPLMHRLGFKPQGDLFYRADYKNFRECLEENEFSGEDLYIDNGLRVKMECDEFTKTIHYFVSRLMWIRVSSERYINLGTEKYRGQYEALLKYKKFALETCRGRFMTPYSFSRIQSGIEEIDGDDFELVFYEDVLLASGANRSTVDRNHIFFVPDDSEYRCNAPDFIKYVITNEHGGSAKIPDVRETLETEYGIRASLPSVRYFASQSCILSREEDTAYSSYERYLEDLKNVQ